MISPFTSFIYFVGLTTVYFTLKYFLAENKKITIFMRLILDQIYLKFDMVKFFP